MTQSEEYWQEREQQMADAHAMEVGKLQERISMLEDELAALEERANLAVIRLHAAHTKAEQALQTLFEAIKALPPAL